MNISELREWAYPVQASLCLLAAWGSCRYYLRYRREPAGLLLGVVFVMEFIAQGARFLVIGGHLTTEAVIPYLAFASLVTIVALALYLRRIYSLTDPGAGFYSLAIWLLKLGKK